VTVRCVALSGGVGGAKLALGLARILAPDELLIVANVGDDFDHLGLRICPDLDTLTYVLAGLDDTERGWGRAGETWEFMAALAALGGETWFNLGDKDLALHVERTHRLASGETLSQATDAVTRRLGIAPRIVPASDDPVRTIVETRDGTLAFQHYFVRERCRPAVTGFRYDGSDTAQAHPAALAALGADDLLAVVICPSNPYVSINPILAIPALRRAVERAKAPVIAVSPIVGGRALKGPTAKIMGELGHAPSADAAARHYGPLIDGYVLDAADADTVPAIRALGMAAQVAPTVMRTEEDKVALARAVLDFAASLA
jgi:LPPG:FO 2-phospho-L-lactate transferase